MKISGPNSPLCVSASRICEKKGSMDQTDRREKRRGPAERRASREGEAPAFVYVQGYG